MAYLLFVPRSYILGGERAIICVWVSEARPGVANLRTKQPNTDWFGFRVNVAMNYEGLLCNL